MVLSPEYKDVKKELHNTRAKKEAMEKYCFEASTKSSVDRITNKGKTGGFTGSYGINPLNNALISNMGV